MALQSGREELVRELELFIQYSVQENERHDAQEMLRRYVGDIRALQLMKGFYTSLPETHEEAVARIVFIQKKEDIFLLGLCTRTRRYLYLVTEQRALLLGEYGSEFLEPEAVSFFGFTDVDEFFKKYPTLLECEEYAPAGTSSSNLCPVCSAVVGENHLLGCPVEVCPWCDGQFSRCGCRFEQLGVDVLEDEEALERLERILEEKGRIPYAREQRPTFLQEVGK